MKTKLIYILMSVTFLLYTDGCSEDFLDHPVTGSVSDDNIGQVLAENPLQIESFLANAYRTIGHIYMYGRFMFYSLPEMAHEADLNHTADLSWNEFAKNDVTSVNSYVSQYYSWFYSVLATLNQAADLLLKMDKSLLSNDMAQLMDNYLGEVYFLRAFCNFKLLCLFGEKGPAFGGSYPNNKDAQGIVLMLESATVDNAIVGRSTVEECYQAILADLKQSLELIGDNQIPANTTSMSPGALDIDYTKDFSWAQKPAVRALLGKVYLYMADCENAKKEFEAVINDSRFKLNKPVNFTDYIQHSDNNPECIFSLQYYYYTGPADTYTGAPSHMINRICTNVPGAWKNVHCDMRTAARFGDDPRLYEATLYDVGWSSWSTSSSPPVWTELDVNDPQFRYYPRKYIDFFNTSSPRDGTKNVDLIRLADVYLMYAEAQLMTGNTPQALEYVNKVRRRAWGEVDYDAPGTKGEDLISIDMPILQEERYKELFFENIRWYDLCRWGILQQELAKYPSSAAGVVTYNDHDYYLPMPEGELSKNILLKQSKGY